MIKNMDYHIIDIASIYNVKCHDLLNIHMKNSNRFTIFHMKTIAEFEEYVENNNNSNVVAIIYYCLQQYPITLPLMQKIASYDSTKLKLKILVLTYDYWHNGFTKPYLNSIKFLHTPKNHYVHSFAENLEQLGLYHNVNYTPYKDKYIFLNLWSCYNSSFVKFNDNPIQKIAISGNKDRNTYSERHILTQKAKKDKRIVNLQFVRNNDLSYNERLNQYICCFSSSVRVRSIITRSRKYYNTHLIILKYFEILASGSLLLCPDTEEIQLNRFGIYNNINCIMTPMKSIDEKIDYILNPENREEIDKIRKAGQEIARTQLNSKNKFDEFLSVLDNKFKLDDEKDKIINTGDKEKIDKIISIGQELFKIQLDNKNKL